MADNRKQTSEYLYRHEQDAWRTDTEKPYVSEEELQHLLETRRERYTEGYRKAEKPERKLNKYFMLTIMGIILAYFVTAFVLNTVGVISKLTMLLMVTPVLVITLLVYFIYQKRRKNGL